MGTILNSLYTRAGVNAAFNIAKRGIACLSEEGTEDSVRFGGAVLVTPYSGDLILCGA
jgi:transposase